MTISSLSLPLDIPWTRLCVSEDMLDRRVCNRRFPYRWRSSVAVFGYQPPDDQQNYPGMIVSYLKVACTITGFQPDPEEVGLDERRIDSSWNDPVIIENYKEMVSQYYGCYGAILEVSVAPAEDGEDTAAVPLKDFPYFIDFDPKKREVYEIVSETGEMMSRSLDEVGVRKGTTTSDSHEQLDIFGGFSQEFTFAGTGGGHSIQGQWGSRDISQQQYEDVRSTDRARELRETFSHTTQLTQMYHQFTSYHLGTNRAVFFMLPRPHIVESEKTFVNGPRELEGIQEIFLVVMRPRRINGICVEAYLETAHLFKEPIYEYETSTGQFTLDVEAACVGAGTFGVDTAETVEEKSETYVPPDGWEVDLDRHHGYRIESENSAEVEESSIKATRGEVTAFARVKSLFIDNPWPIHNDCVKGYMHMQITVFIRKKDGKIVDYKQRMWLTGRGVCCCPRPFQPPELADSLTWEGPPIDPFDRPDSPVPVPVERRPGLTILQANRMRSEIGRQLVRSMHQADRHPRGGVGFASAQFVAEQVAKLIRVDGHVDNQALNEVRGLDPYILRKVSKVKGDARRGWLLTFPLRALKDIFKLSQEEAVKLRRALLGLEGPLPEPADRWQPPGRRVGKAQIVPDVRGLSIDEARRLLDRSLLNVGGVSVCDSPQPRNTVLKQHPEAGSEVVGGSAVDLEIATGLSVQIPDVVGRPLSQALCELRDAGLRSEPELAFVASLEWAKNQVLDVTPAARTFVTPHASVKLRVSRGYSAES